MAIVFGRSALDAPPPAPPCRSGCRTSASACGACLDGFAFADCECDEGATETTFDLTVTAGQLLQVAAIPHQFQVRPRRLRPAQPGVGVWIDLTLLRGRQHAVAVASTAPFASTGWTPRAQRRPTDGRVSLRVRHGTPAARWWR